MRFELPTSITPSALGDKVMKALPADVSKSLTNASHEAIGFAAMAAKKVNDARLDVNGKYEPQVRELRKNAVGAVRTLTKTRTRIESAVDPLLDRALERLPENVQDTLTEAVKVSRQAASTSERRIVDVIEFATAIPTKAVRRPAAAGTTQSSAKKGPASKKVSKPAAAKTTSAKKTTKTASAKKTAKKATKPAARRAKAA